jgi:hypothetical protein
MDPKSAMGRTEASLPDLAMTVFTPKPEAVAATSRTASRLDVAFQAGGEFRCVILDTVPIGSARAFWCSGDNGVDHCGVEGAVNHQRFGNGEHRRAVE